MRSEARPKNSSPVATARDFFSVAGGDGGGGGGEGPLALTENLARLRDVGLGFLNRGVRLRRER